MIRWLFVLGLVLSGCGGRVPSAGEVRPEQFEIVSLSYNFPEQARTFHAAGEIKNNGTLPGAPEVQVVARDTEGGVIGTLTWVPSTRNLEPGESWPFDTSYITIENRTPRDVTARVTQVKDCRRDRC
jgi:hypothetical protein